LLTINSQPSGDLLETSKIVAMVKAMKAEREMCIQDITYFKQLRDSVKARKNKPWFLFN
jgi:hypothetical protein